MTGQSFAEVKAMSFHEAENLNDSTDNCNQNSTRKHKQFDFWLFSSTHMYEGLRN